MVLGFSVDGHARWVRGEVAHGGSLAVVLVRISFVENVFDPAVLARCIVSAAAGPPIRRVDGRAPRISARATSDGVGPADSSGNRLFPLLNHEVRILS
jgi:hypothetical protein